MPNYKPPFNLDPDMVIRNPDKFPRLFLRGIYDVMERERKAGRGSLMERYRKGFNVIAVGMVKARPPRIRVNPNKEIELASYGYRREVQMRRGKEAVETDKKMKKLYIWLDQLRLELEESQPKDTSPTIRGGGRGGRP